METTADGAEHEAPAARSGDAATHRLHRHLRAAPFQLPRATSFRLRRTAPFRHLRAAPRRLRRAAPLLIPVVLLAAVPLIPRETFHGTRWEFLPALAALSVLHYVFAALALRGVSGRRLPLLRTTLAQFTAAAANRVTPGGLGAAAVNTRYLTCHGLPLPQAAVAVAAMQLVGVPADLLLIGAVLTLSQDSHTLTTLGAQAADLLPTGPLLALLLVLLPATALWGRRAARSTLAGQAIKGLRDLANRPRDLALTLTASAATTLVLGVAFALSLVAVPGTNTDATDTLPLVAAYLLAAAAAAAIPTPGSIGSTEAALVAAAAALGVAAAPALQAVLLFRAITFWAPVPVGLLSTRTLRRYERQPPPFTK
ncbi:lysylphosphatidylglycerol synthase transmembrane domain-containing protein [Actinomadura hibisca]|uniref:lysylphosphatidylglycerol synthase transmembrane domain-containing protein n=1 Tax=Actinomadura hibisca TaxID=68565 RepID=UPI0008347A79|nr:lysylphosphatidylglycerol synthase domain-containing protein [Actinomadura hibisca]